MSARRRGSETESTRRTAPAGRPGPARTPSRAKAKATTAPPDDTRARLLEAARHLFAEHGFDGVTVRDLCRAADANLALVNYHFGGKQQLYVEVVDEAVKALTDFNAVACGAPADATPDQKIEHFVRAFVARVMAPPAAESWVHKLIQHELARPTSAAPRIARRAVGPRIRYLIGVVAELLDRAPDDPRVLQGVGSVHGLCLAYRRMTQVPAAFRDSIPEFAMADSVSVEAHVDHAVAFALAGLQSARRVRRGTASTSRTSPNPTGRSA